jgi:tetratricopeptide (TPR) repeat protein
LVPELIEQMDKAARAAEKWERLALAYHRLAYNAHERGRADRAKLYADRMLEILREHLSFQDPRRGNTNAIIPVNLALLLLELDRRSDFDELVKTAQDTNKVALIEGMAEAQMYRHEYDLARATIETELKPLAPGTVTEMLARLEGPEYHARRGEIVIAVKQLGQQREPKYHEVADLAMWAHEGGHDDAARKAIELSLAELAKDELQREWFDEKAKCVREFVAVGDFEPAVRLLNNSSSPGLWARNRLARTYLKKGDTARSQALLDEALARSEERGSGSAMADIAVQLYRLGQHQRAQKTFLEAMDHIAGEDFGFGGTSDIVRAAMKMNRLDLLDQLYERSDLGERMLLCITASNAGAFDMPLEAED